MERGNETKPANTVDRVDLSKKVWVVFYQTTSKNLFDTFDQEAAARDYAERRAEGGATVAIFGPQKAVLMPPEKPIVKEMALDFANQAE